MPQAMAKRIEQVIGRFLWSLSGKVLRVSLEEMKNPLEKGGCGLTCIMSMSKSLLLSQVLRLLKSKDQKSIGHLGYWIGEVLGDLLPGVELGDHALVSVEYYDYLASLVVEAKLSDQVTAGNWKTVTNKTIYLGFSGGFPVPKVEVEAGMSYALVWRSLSSPCLTSVSKEIYFLLIHNKLPVKERLFRIRLSVDPYCQHCIDLSGAVICDLEHYFCVCSRVSHVWKRLKLMIVNLLSVGIQDLSDWKLINLQLPRSRNRNEVIWLLGIYVTEVWARGAPELGEDQFFGFLKYKYRLDQLGARWPLNPIPGLL